MVAFVVSGLHVSKIFIRLRLQLTKKNGGSRSVRLKTVTVRQLPKKSLLISTRNIFCTFGIGICKLVYLGYPGAQRAQRRVILHDLGSQPRSSLTIFWKIMKNYEDDQLPL